MEKKKPTSDPFSIPAAIVCIMLTGPVAAAVVFCVGPRGVVTATVDAIYGLVLQRFDITDMII